MILVYHNPRCKKSREALKFLEEQQQNVTIIKYLVDTPTETELKEIIEKLNISPIHLVRVKEQIWKDEFKDKNLSDNLIIKSMISNPKLIERPIVINGNKAVIARPTEKILEII